MEVKVLASLGSYLEVHLESTSRLSQVINRIRFHLAVELRSLFSLLGVSQRLISVSKGHLHSLAGGPSKLAIGTSNPPVSNFSDFCLPLLLLAGEASLLFRVHVITLVHLNNSGYSPYLKVNQLVNLITCAKSLLSCKVTYS